MSKQKENYIEEVITESENSDNNDNFPKEDDFINKSDYLEYKYLGKKRNDDDNDDDYNEKEKLIKEIKKIENELKNKNLKLMEENKTQNKIINKMGKTIEDNLKREKENEQYYLSEINLLKKTNDETTEENVCLYEKNYDQNKKINLLEKQIKEKDDIIEEQKNLIKDLDKEIESFKKGKIMLECPICFFNYEIGVMHITIDCCHILCKTCADSYINSKTGDLKKCPMCKGKCPHGTKKMNY